MAIIVASQSPALEFGGHDYWMLYDDFGNKVGELHGFAMNNGQITTTAVSGTLYATNQYTMPVTNAPFETVLQGTLTELMPFWNAGVECANVINSLNLSYNAFSIDSLGFNSNNVYSTIGACFGVVAPNVGSIFTPTPGFGEIILSGSAISEVQTTFGISGGPGKFRPKEEIDYPQFMGESRDIQVVGVDLQYAV
ncbi:hypothetical protein SAMN05428959_107138 [Duganella sp. CF517]|uniref:hypothetical protein n=1 Tax=Duganella sp. CF517 TaxID=1881038 RepID=UPI0008C0DE64|nr:hypothetical protein [Duganella sp. CF517]SEO38717.1 hypothetical protein SAMN05428959_107138 [Duganella sp. CF517]